LPAKRLNAERLRQKVREAMSKAPGAARIAAAFKAAGGPVAAAEAFESRLLAPPAGDIGVGRARSASSARR
jgi:UDP:flavonoid glycosyltransferase YjiC (YdhE family)